MKATKYLNKNNYAIAAILRISLILIMSSTCIRLSSQEWTEPTNITNSGVYATYPDMIIDKNGTIHLVWSHVIATNYAKILYTYSDDDGETWAQPTDILSNTSIRMGKPHIAIDRSNNIHVSYDFGVGSANKCVYCVYFDGSQWSEPFYVSEGIGASDYNKIVIDDRDRIFIFWAYGSYYMLYRYFENGYWSNFYCPYCDSLDMFAFSDSHGLSGNQMIWVGSSMSSSYYGERPQYYEFNVTENLWSKPEMISSDTIVVDIAMKLNNESKPSVTYRKRISSPQSGTDLTAYTVKDDGYWRDPEDVSILPGYQWYQQIAIDQFEKPHIIEVHQSTYFASLLHFSKLNENWVEQLIDTCYIINFPKLSCKSNKLYIVYSKTWQVSGGFMSDLFFTKYDILTHIPEAKHTPTALLVFPNPSRHSVTITFELEQQQHVTVSVLDIAGKPIKQVINTVLPSGAHSFTWNGTDNSGRPVNSGTYLVRLQTKQGSATQTVEIAR